MKLEKIGKLRKKFLKRLQANESVRIHPNDLSRVKTNDNWLQRFLEHNEHDISAAVEMLWWTCEWRQKFNVNEILETNVNREYLEDGSCFPYGKDRDGKNLFIVNYKMHRKGVRNTTDMQRCIVYWLERLERQGDGDKISLLLDMSGAGLANVDMELTKLLINACTVFYPNFINYILVLEASFFMLPTLKIIKDWLPENVLPKFKQVRKSTLKDFVDPDVALKSWGGNNPYVFQFISDDFHPVKIESTDNIRLYSDFQVQLSAGDDNLKNGSVLEKEKICEVELSSGNTDDKEITKNQVTSVSKNNEMVEENADKDSSPPAKRKKLNFQPDKSTKGLKSKNQVILIDLNDKYRDKTSEIRVESPAITIEDDFQVIMKQEQPESPIEALEPPELTEETPQTAKSSRKLEKRSKNGAEVAKICENTSAEATEPQKRIKKPSRKILEAAETSLIAQKKEKKSRKVLKKTEIAEKSPLTTVETSNEILDVPDTTPSAPLESPAEISCNLSNPPVETLTLHYNACPQKVRGRRKKLDGPRCVVESPESKADRIVASLEDENNEESKKKKNPPEVLTPEQILQLARMEIKLPHEVPPQHKIETYAGTISLTKEQRKQFRYHTHLKNGLFSEDEDDIIHENWKQFCENHDWDEDIRFPFLQMKHKGFYYLQSIKNRVKFVQFLAQGLPNRTLYSVYHRFRNLWSTYKEGRYTAEEDNYIKNLMRDSNVNGSNKKNKKYSIASKKLNRTRQSVWRRWMLLKKEMSV